MENSDEKIIRLENRVGRLESNAESEKETRAERNREFDKRVDKLEDRIRILEDKGLIQATKDNLIGNLKAAIWSLIVLLISVAIFLITYFTKK